MSLLLSAENVSVHAGSECLVQPASLALHAGRPLTILGETGSGKSLLAQAIIGTLPSGLTAAGRVQVAGQVFDPGRPSTFRRLWGRQIGILPQEPWLSLDPLMPAAAQVSEGHALVRGLPWDQARAAAAGDLAQLGLAQAGHRRPDQLSGGMAQRAAFAAARAGGARIVIADEPTKGLDAGRRNDISALLLAETAAGGGLLTITHDLALARALSGDLVVVLNGRIVERGPAAQVLADPQHDYTRALIAADPAAWPHPRPRQVAGATVLSASGLSVARGGRVLISGMDIDLRPGHIIGISGPSGCGKSTLGDALLGLVPLAGGTVTRAPGCAAVRFQKLYQDPPSAFPGSVTLGRSLADLVARHRLDKGRIGALLDRLRLSPQLLQRRPSEVSGGELQRMALLRVLLLDPVFLFADEPTSRLDLITQAQVTRLMVDVARDTGMGLLIVSHDTDLLTKVCDRVIRLDDPAQTRAA
nr:ATP-binding cassette domain-containing protein [Paracoccus saliphilus]